jgi:hypothetical protein
MKGFLQLRRPIRFRQQAFDFLTRRRRHEKWFKWGIIATTLLSIGVILGAQPRGRYVVAALAAEARQLARRAIDLPTPRSEIDARWEHFRLQAIADCRRRLDGIYDEAGPDLQRLMRYAGLDPEHGLLRWGNFDQTLLLPSKVFEADDSGRSYRMRANTRSIWLRNVSPKSSVLMFFLVPDGPDLVQAIQGTSAIPVESSRQTTNSWGLRGPEPETDAPLRGLVLGDSFMQGLFIGDDNTPTECLRRYLEAHFKQRVSILNTGHLGYSPEQYFYTLLAFAERFRPHFVVTSIFANDFGELYEVLKGKGDWEEGKYWLDEIAHFCRRRDLPHIFVAAPSEPLLLGLRRAGNYPGMISNILEANSITQLDPTDDFINAHLELMIAAQRKGKRPYWCPLFNLEIGDGHFSAVGSKVWADSVGRRIALLLERYATVAPKPR